jgi:hypothetical protein
MIPKTPTNAQRATNAVLSPEEEEVFQDTQEETTQDGAQRGNAPPDTRRSDRKRSQVNHFDSERSAKKQKDSTGTAKNLKEIEKEVADKPVDKFAQLAAMISALDGSINKKLDRQSKEISRKLSETSATIEESLINMDTKIHRLTEDVESLGQRVKKNEKEMPDLVNKAVKGQLSSVVDRLEKLEGRGVTAPSPREARRTADYWEARRSLRISPVAGNLREGLRDLVTKKLGLDGGILDELPGDAIRSLPTRENDRIKHEIVVRFSSVRDRDLVKAAGFKLAGTDSSLRLELPSHLLGVHRTLSRAAADLRKAKPGTRTYVKFDDDSLSMVMDYRLNGGSWQRLRPEQAKEAIPLPAPQAVSEVSAEEFGSLLTPANGANTEPVS